MNMLCAENNRMPTIPYLLKTTTCDWDQHGVDVDTSILIATAFSAGMLHTLFGPDHYVPFVALSKCNHWSIRKTLWITIACGLGHVTGSIAIGSIGLAIGSALFTLQDLESVRGDGAAWLVLVFGLTYFLWGIVRATRFASHNGGDAHHRHAHDLVEMKTESPPASSSLTPWVLFLIFVFGPCEVLIPLLMYPAADADIFAIIWVVIAFTIATLGTMVAAVLTLVSGLRFVTLPSMHRFGHAFAGLLVLTCGAMMKFGF